MKATCLLIALLFLFNSARSFQSPKQACRDRDRLRLSRLTANGRPYTDIAVHDIGNVWLTVTNIGQFGTGYIGSVADPVTGAPAPSCMFPADSRINYLYVGGFWIGAIVGRDTLVSIGIDDYYSVLEFWPDPYPEGEIRRLSIQTEDPLSETEAKSEQDLIAIYTDTVTNPSYVAIDQTDGRVHMPLGIEVTQRSYAWSYNYAEDFILFDYSIKNIGHRILNQVYMAVYVDGDVHDEASFGPEGYGDDVCGFRKTFPAGGRCDFLDTINVAYIIDNDGDPTEEHDRFTSTSARGVAGVRVVRTPSDSLKYSFNWWATDYSDAASDFGPRRAGTPDDPFRDLSGVLGTPQGDRNKYYVMRHEEFDYDQCFTGKDHTSEGWLPRPEIAGDIADGFDARYLLSFGPFSINPGEVLPVSFAWVCGANIHQDPANFANNFDPAQPEPYYNNLDFSDLAKNAVWASKIYDNPGYDTDGDGYFGKYRVCVVETTYVDGQILSIDSVKEYYEGDGVPDFRGVDPPAPPELWAIRPYPVGDTIECLVRPDISENNAGLMTIRWYGYPSELSRDRFSNLYDFEGYRVYQSLSRNPEDFALIASYDVDDFNKYVFIEGDWRLLDPPYTLDSLQKLYGTDFDPTAYDLDNYFSWLDSAFYFAAQDYNESDITNPYGIHKMHPEQPPPTTLNHDTAAVCCPDELTADGYFKYYMYEFNIRNLLPSHKYYFAVTAFDYGSPGEGLASLETRPTANMVARYPQKDSRDVESEGLDVVVYPNPYRIDADYRGLGFEGRGQDDLPDDRVRAIHFANLPHRCTIRIFSIDGDLVREIKHDYPPGYPGGSHETWDLITRNTQAVVSGIYYYSVESETGNQVGKIVIIM